METPEKMAFPEGFLWGSATAAYQVEGDNRHADWWVWEQNPRRVAALKQKGLDPEDFRSGRACDFYHRYEQDFDLLRQLHQNAFRLSVEWSRIEPEEGKFDAGELEHYAQMLASLKKRRIKSFVTLHHFTSPVWFMARGGFVRSQNISYFIRYVQKVKERLGGLADFWITINEPEIYASHAYFYGRYPPEERSFLRMLRVVNNLIRAHNQAAQLLRSTGKPTSMAYHLNDLVPSSIYSKFSRNVLHYLTNEYILSRTIGMDDFIGVNYYGHSHVGVLGRRMHSMTHHEVSDMGWGIHPEGIERVLLDLRKYNKPIYITENGVADAADTKREKFIREHLTYTWRAIQEGCDVRGYLYWSLLDNFEWAHGYGPRFGLAAMNYKTLERTLRPSAHAYAQICENNALTFKNQT